MPRSLAFLLSMLFVALATPAHADPCDWINNVASWDASIGWSWSNGKYTWTQQGGTTYGATTRDAGSATATLVPAFLGDSLAEGQATGSLSFLDRLDVQSTGSPGFTETTASGPIIGDFPLDPPFVRLTLDTLTCTYTWDFNAWAAGTLTTSGGGSIPTTVLPNHIQPGERPIPSVPGPLEFDGAFHASSLPPPDEVTPWFLTYGDSAAHAETNPDAPETLPDAFVHWVFEPGTSVAPDNDSCAGARILFGSEIQDVSFATDVPTDPTSTCGAGDRSVWLFFVPFESGTAQISTSSSGYSTVVSVWPQAETCASLTTQVACGTNGASVPVQAGVPLLVQVQRSAPGGTGSLQIQLTPEPDAAAAASIACAALACLARGRRASRRST